MVCRVYLIICPYTNNVVYIGATRQKIKERYKDHLNSHNYELYSFLFDCIEDKMKPKIKVAKYFYNWTSCLEFEKKLIKQTISDGVILFNKSVGRNKKL